MFLKGKKAGFPFIWLAFLVFTTFLSCGPGSGKNWATTPALSQGQLREASGEGDLPYYSNRIIVAFKRDARAPDDAFPTGKPEIPASKLVQNESPAIFARFLADRVTLGLRNEVFVGDVNIASYEVPSTTVAERLIEELPTEFPDAIEYVEYDGKAWLAYVPNDPFYPSFMWGMVKINAEPAWDVATGNGIKIGIIDTGVRFTDGNPDHEDLTDNVFLPEGFELDLVDGDPIPEDLDGHGTHVAGTAAAIGDNSKGVVGVAFDGLIVPIKVLGGGESTIPYSRVAQAIVTAQEAGCNVINMSLGGSFLSKALHEAIQQAWSNGIVQVASAMNNGDNRMMYPAGYPEVIAVGATNESDARASFSNFGEWVDIAAPGYVIRSTLEFSPSAYGDLSGTSMSAPHVSGSAAVLMEARPELTSNEIRSILEASGDDLNDSEWQNPDIRRLNLGNAIQYTLGQAPSVEITSPTGGQVSGVVEFSADASDGDGTISKVTFYAGDYLLGVDRTAPFSLNWDTTKFPNTTYQLRVIAVDDDYQYGENTIQVTTNNSQIAPDYFDDFEGGTGDWWIRDDSGQAQWFLTTDKSKSPTHSFKFGLPGGGVYHNLEYDLLFSPLFDLSGLTHVKIGFYHFEDFNVGDFGYVAVNVGDGEFYVLESFSGASDSWGYSEVSLDDYIGKSVQVVFIAETDENLVSYGWWIDDFLIKKASNPPSVTITEPQGNEVSGTVWVRATASDDVGISKVEFYVGDSLTFTDASVPYEFQLDTTYLHGGDHLLRALAYDDYPLTDEDSVSIVVKNHSITSFSPTLAKAGSFISIDGLMFIENGASSRDPARDKVFFTGAVGRVEANVTSWRKDRIGAVVPTDAIDGPIYVDIGSASVASSVEFAVLPSVDALSPSRARVGETIDIQGSGFLPEESGESDVKFGSLPADDIVLWSNRVISVRVPAGVKPSPVTVTTKNGTSNGIWFTPIPYISGLSRYRGHPGAQLTINGTSFGDTKGMSKVVFAPNVEVPAANILAWGDTQISLVVPTGAETGSLRLWVNSQLSNLVDFVITLPPPTMFAVEQY